MQTIRTLVPQFEFGWNLAPVVIRKLKSGEYRIYSRNKDSRTGKRHRTSKTAAGRLVPARQFIVDGARRGSTRANGVSNGSEAAGEKSKEPGRYAK